MKSRHCIFVAVATLAVSNSLGILLNSGSAQVFAAADSSEKRGTIQARSLDAESQNRIHRIVLIGLPETAVSPNHTNPETISNPQSNQSATPLDTGDSMSGIGSSASTQPGGRNAGETGRSSGKSSGTAAGGSARGGRSGGSSGDGGGSGAGGGSSTSGGGGGSGGGGNQSSGSGRDDSESAESIHKDKDKKKNQKGTIIQKQNTSDKECTTISSSPGRGVVNYTKTTIPSKK